MLFITLFTSHFLFIHLFLEYFLETQNNRNVACSLQSFLLSIYFPLRCFLSVISAPTRSVRSGFREQVSLAWWPPSHKQAKAPELSSSSCWPHCLVQKKESLSCLCYRTEIVHFTRHAQNCCYAFIITLQAYIFKNLRYQIWGFGARSRMYFCISLADSVVYLWISTFRRNVRIWSLNECLSLVLNSKLMRSYLKYIVIISKNWPCA